MHRLHTRTHTAVEKDVHHHGVYDGKREGKGIQAASGATREKGGGGARIPGKGSGSQIRRESDRKKSPTRDGTKPLANHQSFAFSFWGERKKMRGGGNGVVGER